MKSVFAFMNAYTQAKSGGDIAFIEIFKRIQNYKLYVVTSLLGKKLCQESGLDATYLLTTDEKDFQNIISTYIQRIIKAFILNLKLHSRDLLYATSDALPDTLPIFFLKLKNRKTKWVQKIFHLIPRSRLLSHYSQKLSLFLIKKFADVIIVDNSGLKKNLIKIGFPKDKLSINHLGIDLDYFKKVLPAKITYDAIFMARLHPSKGIFELIKIWSIVVKKLPGSRLAIIGTGDEKIISKLKSRVHNGNLQNNILFLGYLSDAEAFSLIKASRVFIFPSQEEGFGLVILEALACGTPVIAYELPSYSSTFRHMITTIKLNDLDEFTSTVYNVLVDETVRRRMITQARKNINKFSWEKTAFREKAFLLK